MSLKSSFLITGFLVFIACQVNSQGVEMFEYTHLDEGDMAVPKFDKTKAEGTEGVAVFRSEKYVHKLVNSVISHVLSKKTRESLHLGSAVLIAFDRHGSVINCKFFLNRNDRKILTEEELYKIYMRFKKVIINPYQVRMDADPKTGNLLPDYAVISGPLISKAGRKKVISSN